MLTADGPAAGDDSKETSIAVVHPMTNARAAEEGRLMMTSGIWSEG